MWNETSFVTLFVSLRGEKRGFYLPLLLHTGSVADLAEDYADALSLLPSRMRFAPEDAKSPQTAGRARALLRQATDFLRDMRGLKLHVDVRDGNERVRVHIQAL